MKSGLLIFWVMVLSACGQVTDDDSAGINPDAAVSQIDAGASNEPVDGSVDEPVDGSVDVTPMDAGEETQPDLGAEDGLVDGCEQEQEPGHLYSFSAQPMDTESEPLQMCQYTGRVLLIVNTAALCGFTPQYAQLQALQNRFAQADFEVLGFLSNDFGSQAGSAEEVEECESIYGLTFQQFAQVGVLPSSPSGQHPIFEWLTSQEGFEGEIEWNFNKFLVDGSGTILGRWGSLTLPDAPEIVEAIDGALGVWP